MKSVIGCAIVQRFLLFSWSTEDFSGYSVQYETSTLAFAIGEGDEFLEIDDAFEANTIFEASIEFQVVPAPSSVPVLACVWPLLSRRRSPIPRVSSRKSHGT